MPTPLLTLDHPQLGKVTVRGTPGFDKASSTFAVLRPNVKDLVPSVLFMSFSGGAHCCTDFKLVTPFQTKWTEVDLGSFDGEALSEAPSDLNRDGLLDFVMGDNAFLYSFASYAESFTPSRIYNLVAGKFVDVSKSSRFAAVHQRDLVESRKGCLEHNNGACAAYVASAARLGQERSAFALAEANHNASLTQGWLPSRCMLEDPSGGCSPGAEVVPDGFAQALVWFLEDNGYVQRHVLTPQTSPSKYFAPDEADTSSDREPTVNVGEVDEFQATDEY